VSLHLTRGMYSVKIFRIVCPDECLIMSDLAGGASSRLTKGVSKSFVRLISNISHETF
jgi:hypothetical protein